MREIPLDLLDAARVLAKAIDKPIYLTERNHSGGEIFRGSDLGWCITIERDRYHSHHVIMPDGTECLCEVYT